MRLNVITYKTNNRSILNLSLLRIYILKKEANAQRMNTISTVK